MLHDRVKETTTSTGTGNLTLAGAVTNFISFNSAFGTGLQNPFYYFLIDDTNNEWEEGLGYLSASTTLVRHDVRNNSSGTTSALNLSSGTKTVFCDTPYWAVPRVSVGRESGMFFGANIHAAVLNLETATADRVYATPRLINDYVSITGLGIVVDTADAGQIARAAVYQQSKDGLIGDIISDTEVEMSVGSTGWITTSFSSPIILAPGYYWVGFISDGTPTIRGKITSAQYAYEAMMARYTSNTEHKIGAYRDISSGWSSMPSDGASMIYNSGGISRIAPAFVAA